MPESFGGMLEDWIKSWRLLSGAGVRMGAVPKCYVRGPFNVHNMANLSMHVILFTTCKCWSESKTNEHTMEVDRRMKAELSNQPVHVGEPRSLISTTKSCPSWTKGFRYNVYRKSIVG